MHSEWFIFWLIGLAVVGMWAGYGFFSHDARTERRRRKSHSRIISKSARPSIRFSVRPPKK